MTFRRSNVWWNEGAKLNEVVRRLSNPNPREILLMLRSTLSFIRIAPYFSIPGGGPYLTRLKPSHALFAVAAPTVIHRTGNLFR